MFLLYIFIKLVFFWPTGVKHYGEFCYGDITGIGVRYCNNNNLEPNNEIYFGTWKNGKNHGYGTYFWANGARYQGEF